MFGRRCRSRSFLSLGVRRARESFAVSTVCSEQRRGAIPTSSDRHGRPSPLRLVRPKGVISDRTGAQVPAVAGSARSFSSHHRWHAPREARMRACASLEWPARTQRQEDVDQLTADPLGVVQGGDAQERSFRSVRSQGLCRGGNSRRCADLLPRPFTADRSGRGPPTP